MEEQLSSKAEAADSGDTEAAEWLQVIWAEWIASDWQENRLTTDLDLRKYETAIALLTAMKSSFYDHFPLRISPDAIWITLARGFAIHVNENAEKLRDRFVSHSGKQDLKVVRNDFLPGEDNPWPEVFDEFSKQIAEHTGGMSELVEADFSTTGAVERAVSNLMAMETFKSYFEYIMYTGCGTPSITLTGTVEDWSRLRERAQRFANFGLEDWINALDPILGEFVYAKSGKVDIDFWKSMFRYNSGSGPAVMTGWANVFFPYFKEYESDARQQVDRGEVIVAEGLSHWQATRLKEQFERLGALVAVQ